MKTNLLILMLGLGFTAHANARCLYTAGEDKVIQQVKQAYGKPAEERKQKNGESPDAEFRIVEDPVEANVLLATPLGGLRDGEKACEVTSTESKDSDGVRSCKKVSKCIRKIIKERRGVQVTGNY